MYTKIKDLVGGALQSDKQQQEVEILLLEIHRQLLELTDLELINGQNQYGEFGLKLSSENAASCLLCPFRTLKYWQALGKAVKAHPKEQKIRICYPGCGPFATLVLPVLLLFSEYNIELSLLDVNSEAIDSVKKLWQSLQSERLTINFQCTDVLKYQSDEAFDIIIFECLLRALEREAQVAITLHMSQFLQDSGQLIPESIECRLVATCLNSELEQLSQLPDRLDITLETFIKPIRQKALTILKLDKSTRKKVDVKNNCFFCVELDIAAFEQSNWVITTVLNLDQEITLHEYQSGLTFPLDVGWKEQKTKANKLVIGYKMKPLPSFFVME